MPTLMPGRKIDGSLDVDYYRKEAQKQVVSIAESQGKTIESVAQTGDTAVFTFTDGTALKVQSREDHDGSTYLSQPTDWENHEYCAAGLMSPEIFVEFQANQIQNQLLLNMRQTYNRLEQLKKEYEDRYGPLQDQRETQKKCPSGTCASKTQKQSPNLPEQTEQS